MREIHITNAAARNATVGMVSVRPTDPPKLGLPDAEVSFRRYLASSESGLHDELVVQFGEDYAQALVDGDPEVDVEQVGRFVGSTDKVYLSQGGQVLHAPPKVVEIITDPDGQERQRREPEDVLSNVKDELPIRWSGRKVPRAEAARRFVFGRALQLKHTDGLTYDFLFDMAKELAEEDVLVLVGSGPKGRDPLIFVDNGTPYRGFLEGRVDGARYQLLLHLSNIELKRPQPTT